MKIKYVVREEQLLDIARQADLLSSKARDLVRVYRTDADAGSIPLPDAVQNAQRDLQSSIVAIIRVAASYL